MVLQPLLVLTNLILTFKLEQCQWTISSWYVPRFKIPSFFFEVWTYSAPAIAHADTGQSSNLRNIMSHHNSCCLYRNTMRQSWRGLLCISKVRFRPDGTWGFTGRLCSLFHACQLFPGFFFYIVDTRLPLRNWLCPSPGNGCSKLK